MWICWILCWPEPDRVNLISHMWNSPSCLCRSGTSMSAVVCSAPAVLDVSSVLRSCFIVQSENKKKRFILSKITIRNTIVWRVQRLHNKTNKPATPSGRACWCDFGWTETWNLQLIQSCCKVKICGFNSQSVMNEGCLTCPASVWRVVVKNLPTRHINGAVWRHRVDVTVRSQ